MVQVGAVEEGERRRRGEPVEGAGGGGGGELASRIPGETKGKPEYTRGVEEGGGDGAGGGGGGGGGVSTADSGVGPTVGGRRGWAVVEEGGVKPKSSQRAGRMGVAVYHFLSQPCQPPAPTPHHPPHPHLTSTHTSPSARRTHPHLHPRPSRRLRSCGRRGLCATTAWPAGTASGCRPRTQATSVWR